MTLLAQTPPKLPSVARLERDHLCRVAHLRKSSISGRIALFGTSHLAKG